VCTGVHQLSLNLTFDFLFLQDFDYSRAGYLSVEDFFRMYDSLVYVKSVSSVQSVLGLFIDIKIRN